MSTCQRFLPSLMVASIALAAPVRADSKPDKPIPPKIEPVVQNNPYLYWLVYHRSPMPPHPYPVPTGPGYTVLNNVYTPVSSTNKQTATPQTTVLPPSPLNIGVVALTLPTTAAAVWIDGKKMESGLSAIRVFTTPELEKDHTYYYTFKAEWVHRGENVSEERTVTVSAGKITVVDFNHKDKDKSYPAY